MPTLEINGKTLHFADEGEGDVLLLGHSYLWDHRMWSEQIAELSKGFRCIAPDLWGHGGSGPLVEDKYSVTRLAEDYWALMQALGVERFSILGLSVGGMWATELALQHPEAVQALVIMDTYLGAEPAETQAQYFAMLDVVSQCGAIPEPMVEQLLPMFLSPVTLAENPLLVEQFREDLKGLSPEQIPTVVTLGRAIFSRVDRLDRLPTLTMPTLVMVGEHDQPRPVHEAKEMAGLIPNAQLAVIENAGHIPAKEQPQAVNRLLDAFLVQ